MRKHQCEIGYSIILVALWLIKPPHFGAGLQKVGLNIANKFVLPDSNGALLSLVFCYLGYLLIDLAKYLGSCSLSGLLWEDQ